MRVIYDTCIADPWIKVAQKLEREHGYKTVYWIGYNDDDSADLVPQAFPEAIYHANRDVWKEKFPAAISEKFASSYIDIDLLKAIASYELQAVKMMDRMDPDRCSFNFMERQRHFRNLLKYWSACIDLLKPDLVISESVPHQVFDYVLFLLCRSKKIKFICFRGSALTGWSLPLTNISTIGDAVDDEYSRMRQSGDGADELKQKLPREVLERYEKVKANYALAQPEYMKQHLLTHIESSNLPRLARKFFLDLFRFREKYFGKRGFFRKGIPTIYKQRGVRIEKSRSTIMNYALLKWKAMAFKKKLKKHYDSLVSTPDLSVPYVMFNLHFQPEMTSSPAGDIFVDQRLCVDVLAKQLPPGYLIYVKEHPSQFFAHTGGHTSRILEFYDDLSAYPQVRLLPMGIDPFLLYKKSRAVATVTGTAGWEAMALGKPVIIFGLSWYEKYSGVLKVTDERSAARIAGFIENFRFDERDLLSYLYAFCNSSVRAYLQRGWRGKVEQSEEDCVSNLVHGILRTVAAK